MSAYFSKILSFFIYIVTFINNYQLKMGSFFSDIINISNISGLTDKKSSQANVNSYVNIEN